MEKFDSISHFIQSGDFQYRIFDMGRKLTVIDNHLFAQLENQQQVYPYPFQQKAWLALLIWEAGKQHQSVIWFLQFPIDELGFLKQQSRDAFLIDLLEQTGKNIQAKQHGKKVLDELNESPFAFKPAPARLAMFHALATRELDQQASQFYQHAHDYLSGESGYEQWQFLGLQGVADVVARLDQDTNEQLLVNALGKMPDTPLETFSQMLENVAISEAVFEALNKCLDNLLKDTSANVLLISALLRGMSGADFDLRQKAFLKVLASPQGKEIEVLAAISGRSWDALNDVSLLNSFVENLAQHEQATFNAILADLLMIPKMRDLVFEAMRNPKRSNKVGEKFGVFLKAIKAT